jgi:hypothetical protein
MAAARELRLGMEGLALSSVVVAADSVIGEEPRF